MQLRQIPVNRPPSRLSHNKQNIQTQLNSIKKPLPLHNKQTQNKYGIYFPKEEIKRKPFFDQPENMQTVVGLKIVKPNKSFSKTQSPAKKIVQDVKKRLSEDDSQKNQQLMKKRKSLIGAQAYIPTTFKDLKLAVKKR